MFLCAENMVRYALHLAVHIRRQFVTHVLHNLMEREGVQGNRSSCYQEERRTLAKDGDFVP
jgi:hypothetical protein